MQRLTQLFSRTLAPTRTALTPAATISTQTHSPKHPVASHSYGTTSSPKSAEKASAESGGSRSKDAAEPGSSPTGGAIRDGLSEGDARGRTGGGEPLDASHAPPAQPKIYNASVHGGTSNMTEEQKAEVDAHNREFEKKHGKAQPAGDDKVNKSFWRGTGERNENS